MLVKRFLDLATLLLYMEVQVAQKALQSSDWQLAQRLQKLHQMPVDSLQVLTLKSRVAKIYKIDHRITTKPFTLDSNCSVGSFNVCCHVPGQSRLEDNVLELPQDSKAGSDVEAGKPANTCRKAVPSKHAQCARPHAFSCLQLNFCFQVEEKMRWMF